MLEQGILLSRFAMGPSCESGVAVGMPVQTYVPRDRRFLLSRRSSCRTRRVRKAIHSFFPRRKSQRASTKDPRMDHSIVLGAVPSPLAALLVGSHTGSTRPPCALRLAPCALPSRRLDTDHRPTDPFARPRVDAIALRPLSYIHLLACSRANAANVRGLRPSKSSTSGEIAAAYPALTM
jgi:hypothetical protein